MTIEYKDSKRIVKLSSDVVETPTYTANYDDTNTWTKTGTKTTVNETVSGKVNWNFSSNYTSAENHLETTPLGFTLDNEKWVCDFEFNASAFDNSAETFLVVFQENAGDFISTSGDGLTCAIYSNKTIRLWKKDGSTHSIDSNANAITIATGTDYYARFSRTSATVIKFELFTDSARTAHVSGSPITFTFSETIQGLDNLTHCGRSDNVGATKTYNVSLDNLKIWNGVASVSSKPTNVQDNSILVEKDTARRYWGTNKVTTEEVYNYTTAPSTSNKLTGTPIGYSADAVGVELVSSIFAGKYIKTGKWMLKRVGTLGSNAFMKVQDSSGTVKATSAGVAASGIGTSAFEYVTFTLPTAVELANGDRVYVEYTGADTSGDYLAIGEKHPSTTPTGWEFTVYNVRDVNGNNPSGVWGDDGYPTALVPTATFDLAPASNVTSDSITWNAPSKTPAEIGDLKVHYDATVGVTASSNSVSAWADQSGNGKTLSSVSNPTRVEAGQNGKDYIDFNSSKSMRASGLSEDAPRPFSMVIVINPRNTSDQSIIRWGQSPYLALYQYPVNTYYISGGTDLGLSDSTLDGSWNAFFMDFKSNADGGTLQINLDTANAVSGNIGNNGTSGSGSNSQPSTLHVGVNGTNNNWYANCRYAEIIMFDKVLTAYEKEQLYGHLKTKWGLP